MFRVVWKSIKDVFDEMFLMILTNLLWCAISAPLLGLAAYAGIQGAALPATILAMLGVLPLGPANAGIYTIAQRATEGRTSKVNMFFAAMREHAVFSWKVYGAWMAGLITILFNYTFYRDWNSGAGAFMQVLFIYMFFIWLAFLIYIGPLMLLQSDKRLRTVARNAALMTFGRPIFTLVTLVMMVVISILAMIPGLILLPGLILFALLSVWGFNATNRLIEEAEERRRKAEEEAAAAGSANYSNEKGRGGQVRPRD